MKKLHLVYIFFVMTILGFTSCDSAQSAINDLEDLSIEIETNHQSYTEEDWNDIALSYSAIEEELTKYEYTDEDLKKIGKLKGKCLGYMTKQTIKDAEKELRDYAKEIEGGIESFFETLSEENN